MRQCSIVLAVLGLCGSLFGQVSIPITNPSFEALTLADGDLNYWNAGHPSGWTFVGAVDWQAGVTNPSLGLPYPETKEAQDGQNILWMTTAGATATQALGVRAVTGTFTLRVWVSHRKITTLLPEWGPNPYDLDLLVDGVPATAATVTKPTTNGDIWQLAEKTYAFADNDPAVGKLLSIRLTNGGKQQIFDNVSLTCTNLLFNNNPSFTTPIVAANCDEKSAPDGWTGFFKRNASYHNAEPCPRNGDYFWGSKDDGGSNWHRMRPNAAIAIPPTNGTQTYKFSGLYYLGDSDAAQPTTAYFEIYTDYNSSLPFNSEPPAAPRLAVLPVAISNGNTGWAEFSVTVTPSAGTDDLTVVMRLRTTGNGSGTNGGTLHVDNLNLNLETICPNQPMVNAIDTVAAVRGTSFTMTVTGQNFTSANGTPTVSLTNGEQTFNATAVTVVDPTQVTASFTLPADAVHDTYVGTYSQVGCTSAPLPAQFLVYLPALSNGNFENPDTAANCSTPTDAVPSDWMATETGSWGYSGQLKLNGFIPSTPALSFLPTCPGPDAAGKQYATMASNTSTAGANSRATQTVAVNAGTEYTLSGFFAGSGDNTVLLQLRDGGPGGAIIPNATTTINDGPGSYDWRFSYVKAAAPGTVLTGDWSILRRGGEGVSQNAAHADKLMLESCSSTVSVSSVLPSQAVNDAEVTVQIAAVGFSGSPTVFLSKAGGQVFATSTSVDGSGTITAVLPLASAMAGRYDLIVKQGGCIAELWAGFNVIGSSFVNGSFELPAAPQTACQTGAPKPIQNLPTGWSFEGELVRDHAVERPACPVPDGIHYGSMTNGGGEMRRAWQTLRVLPGQQYKFSGLFVGGNATVTLRLLQGDELTGTEIAAKTVMLAGSAWVADEVIGGTAAGNIMTVVWEMVPTGTGLHAAHADSLSFVPFGVMCNNPVMDADDDDDVDQIDFGAFQRCFTGSNNGPVPSGPGFEYCRCFNSDASIGDTDIDSVDMAAFENCASGPGIPANAACDGT